MKNLDLKHLRFTSINGNIEGNHLLILAGVHGDEYEPMAAARILIKIIPSLLICGKITVAPVVNFSAFQRASRTGEDGLDLARICPGNMGGSISEIVAAEVSLLISTADFLIDLHSGGNEFIIDSLCGYILHESISVLEKQREMAKAFNLKTIWGTSSKLNGRTLSVARDQNIPAIYTEFGGGGGYNSQIAEEYVQGCLNVMRLLGMCGGKLPKMKSEYELEDYRKNSGHLQIMLPAASDGFFESQVALGDTVRHNQPIGTIYDPFGKTIKIVCADQDGMVFMLRAIPSVKMGDTLGGILPLLKPGKFKIL